MSNLTPPTAAEERGDEFGERLAEALSDRIALVNTIHGWCPYCAGHGMVMGLGGPDDCPNLDAHRFLASIPYEPKGALAVPINVGWDIEPTPVVTPESETNR